MNRTGPQDSVDRWDTYLQWNAALARIVYGPHVAGLPVYLDPEEEVLCAAAEAIGVTADEPRSALLEALRPTLNASSHQAGMFGGHLVRLRRWKPESGDPPPIIGLLAVLCVAAEDMRESDGFAANNYYDRLMPLLGVSSDSDKKRVVSSYRKISFDLWESLNGWLENVHGEQGLPTAYAYAHVHIGRPLSQALIRAADRAKLDEFFADLGLEQRSRLSPEDIEPLLTAWINRNPSPASQQIQAMWKRAGARERIAEIASQLLEAWEPPPGVKRRGDAIPRAGGRQSTLRLLALLRNFPAPTLELNLIGPDVSGERVARLIDATDGADLGVDLALDSLPDGRWRLAEADELDSRSLAEGAITLGFASGTTLDRRPRRVVPLKKDDLLQAFVEVERLALGEDGMILCTAPLATLVEEALGKVARPGFRRVAPTPPGCPPDWALFTHIQVLVPLFSTSPAAGVGWPLDLNVLQPLATSQLVVQGGLQLPGRVRRWSSRAAPEIRAAGEDIGGLRLTIDRVGAFQEATRVLDQSSGEPFVLVDLRETGLSDGDYEIAVTSAGIGSRPRLLNTARLRLRSGTTVNPTPRGEPPLARAAGAESHGVLFASPWDGESACVRGAAVSPPGADIVLRRAGLAVPGWWQRRQEQSKGVEPSGDTRQRLSLSKAGPEDCFQTGAHVLQLPTYYGTATTKTVEGFCKHCGLVKRFPGSYYKLLRRSSQPKQQTATPPTFHLASLPSVLPDPGVTPDIALDALTHDLTGPASWLEQVALQVEPSQLFVDRFVRSLDLLAHIEVRRDVKTLAPVAWEVVPPTLVELPSIGFVLCGRRSRRIEHAVLEAAAGAGVAVERTSQGVAAPDRILVSTTSRSVAQSIAELASTATSLDIAVINDSALQIAATLPSLSTVVESLPRQAMVAARSIKRWSTDVARWRPVGDASVPGAYQLLSPTPVYCLRDHGDIENGTLRRVDFRLAKYAAALAEEARTIGYDEETHTLYVPLGADLPGLYGRAAVLCSGLLPFEDERQRVTRYHAVPRDIAEHIAALLEPQSGTP